MKRFVWLILLVPAAIIVIALSVANRNPVAFTIDPFAASNPYLTFTAPLFAFLFASLILGLLIGSISTWLAQGKHRRKARQAQIETDQLRAEMRKRDEKLRDAPALSIAS
jgi:uncharacterized membrane protein YciS (DUF1049 family)